MYYWTILVTSQVYACYKVPLTFLLKQFSDSRQILCSSKVPGGRKWQAINSLDTIYTILMKTTTTTTMTVAWMMTSNLSIYNTKYSSQPPPPHPPPKGVQPGNLCMFCIVLSKHAFFFNLLCVLINACRTKTWNFLQVLYKCDQHHQQGKAGRRTHGNRETESKLSSPHKY